MSNLDVALRLRLINGLKKPAKDAEKDLQNLKKAGERLNGARIGARMSGELGKVWTASAKAAQGFSQLQVKAAAAAVAVARVAPPTAKMQAATKTTLALAGAYERLSVSTRKLKSGPRGFGALPASARAQAGGGVGMGTAAAAGLAARVAPLAGGALGVAGVAALGGAAGAGMAGAAVLGRSKGAALSFEKAMNEVEKATNATGAELKKYEDMVLRLSVATGQTKEDIAAMTAQAGFAGRPTHEIARFTEYAAMATKAWGMSASETGDGLAQVGNIYGANQKRLEEIADAINTTADVSAARESHLVDFLTRVGGPAKQLGITAEQTLAIGGALKEIGVQPSVAATGFQALLNNISRGEDATPTFEENLTKLGLSAEKLKKSFSKNPTGAIVDLLTRINKMSDGMKRTELLVGMFGKEYADDMGRLSGHVHGVTRLLGILGDRASYVGSTQKQFQQTLTKDFSKIERAEQSIDRLATRIGGPLKAAFGQVADEANKMLDTIERGDTAFQRLSRYVSGRFADPDGVADLEKKMNDQAAAEAKPGAISAFIDRALGKTGDEAELRGRIAKFKTIVDEAETQKQRLNDLEARRPAARTAGARRQLEEKIAEQQARARAAQDIVDGDLAATRKKTADAQRAVDANNRLLQMGQVGRVPGAEQPQKGADIGGVSPGLLSFPLVGNRGFDIKKQRAELDAAAAAAARLKGELSPELAAEATKSMSGYNAALKTGAEQAVQTALSAAARMKEALSFTATPTIAPRITAPSAAPAGGAVAPKKSAARGGGLTIATAHFHGVKDMAGMHRQAVAMVDRQARARQAGALHDTDIGDTA